MTGLSILDFETNPVRMLRIDGDPCWIAADVCRCLGLANNRQALACLDDDEKGVTISDTLGGNQQLLYVNESGLYHLIFKSRKAEAVRFRKWVTREVLPTIRKTGGYGQQATDLDDRVRRLESRLMLPPLRQISPRTRVENGQKPCSRCAELKPLSEFPPSPRGAGGRHSQCRPCTAERMRIARYARLAAAQEH